MEGVGKLHVHLISAVRSDVFDAAEGDYYVRAVIEESSGARRTSPLRLGQLKKTKIVRSSAAPIFNAKWRFLVPNYKVSLRLSLINSRERSVIGHAVVSIYSIQMRDAELYECDWQRAGVELYPIIAADPQGTTGEKGARSSEKAVIGKFTVKAHFEEDVKGLFEGKNPRLALDSPPEEFSVERLSKHISRYSAFIDLVVFCYSEYCRLMSWESPLVTLMSLFGFIYITLTINAEYALSVPLFLLVALTGYLWHRRSSGQYRKSFVQKLALRANSRDNYRPIARIRIAVVDFNINNSYFSPAVSMFGLKYSAKKPFVRITYKPTMQSLPPSDNPRSELLVGCVDGSGGSSFSEFVSHLSNKIIGVEGRESDCLIQSVFDPWPCKKSNENDDTVLSIIYPVLQPKYVIDARFIQQSEDADGDSKNESSENGTEMSSEDAPALDSAGKKCMKPKDNLVPWTENEELVRFNFYDERPSKLMDSLIYASWGFVEVPIKALVPSDLSAGFRGELPAVEGWFPIEESKPLQPHEAATYEDISLLDGIVMGNSVGRSSPRALEVNGDAKMAQALGLMTDAATMRSEFDRTNESSRRPQRQPLSEAAMRDHDRNKRNDCKGWVCLKLQLDLSKTCDIKVAKEADKKETMALVDMLTGGGKTSTTISTLWNLRENVRYVQNLMGSIIDCIEKFTNILLWTSPMVWLATAIIPGRYIILAVGLYEFLFVFIPEPEGTPMVTKFSNFLQSIPTNDDLDQVYELESSECLEKALSERRSWLQSSKLNLVLPVRWSGSVTLKWTSNNGSNWLPAYLVLQGKRLIWWNSEVAMTENQAALGQLILCGHCGTSQASPLEVRSLECDESRVLSVFGRDPQNLPMKCTIQFWDNKSREAIEKEIAAVVEIS